MASHTVELLQPGALREHCARVATVAALSAESYAGRLVELPPGQILRCRPPLFVEHDPARQHFFFGKPLAACNLDYHFAPAYLASLPYARLIGNNYVVVSADRRVITDSYSGAQILQANGHFLQRTLKLQLDGEQHDIPFVLLRLGAEPPLIERPCVLPIHYWHFNYHHWLIECLPRLRWALEAPELRHASVILPPELLPFQHESLDLIGLPPERVLPFAGPAWRIKQVYFPSIGAFSPDELRWVRAICLRGVPDTPRAASEGLYYISRADAGQRRLANESEIVAYLKTRGFEALHLAGMPFRRQVELFRTARMIVGPHGAGLTNMLWAPSGMTLIELMPNDSVNHCYWLMANVLEQHYTFLAGPVISPQRDFVISLPQLQQLLDTISSSAGHER